MVVIFIMGTTVHSSVLELPTVEKLFSSMKTGPRKQVQPIPFFDFRIA